MQSISALFGTPPPMWIPLIFGTAGLLCVFAGGILRGRLHPGLRLTGSYFCITGLSLMSLGLICLSGRLSHA